MKITAEQLQNDITALEGQLEQAKASVAQTTGALSVLRNIKAYVEAPEPVEQTEEQKAEEQNKISDENAEIQKTVQDRQDALSLQQVAELVAGPGATAEEPTVVKISDGVRMVADGRGQYRPVPMEEVEA